MPINQERLDKAIAHVANNPTTALILDGTHGVKAVLISMELYRALQEAKVIAVGPLGNWNGEP